MANGSWEGEFEVRRKDGNILPAHAIDVLLKDDGGLPLGFVGVSVDINRTAVPKFIAPSPSDVVRAVRIARLGCWDYDLLQDRLEWADEALTIFGTTRDRFAGTLSAFLAFVHPDERELAGKGAEMLEVLRRTRDGKLIQRYIER